MAREIVNISNEIPDYPLQGTPWYKEGYYLVSPHNTLLVDSSNDPSFVAIHDVTLRDGEQTPGITFTEDERVYIGELLSDLNVSRIEAGMPIVSDVQFNAMKRLAQKNLKSEIYGFARAVKKDVELVSATGASGIIIEHCVNPHTCKYGYNLKPEELVKRMVSSIKRAHELDLKTVFMGWDWFRAPVDFTLWLVDAILQETDLDGLAIVDTVGCTLPDAVEGLFKIFHEQFPQLPLEFHGHNDFNLGIACAVSAIKGGASVIHTSMNALGERTGNTATEEVVACLEILKHINTGVDMSQIDRASRVVSEISKIPIHSSKPLLGERNYIVESGVATHLMLSLGDNATDPSYGAFSSKIIGRDPKELIRLGKNSGKSSIELILKKHNITYNDEIVNKVLELVKREGIITKAIVSEESFLELVKRVISS